MAIEDEDVKTLTCLGLTSRQAKAYLSLIFSGASSVRTISTVSKVARQDTYRILKKLHNLGLIEKEIANPTLFKAIPLETGLAILLQQKTSEMDEAHARTKELLNKFQKKTRPTFNAEESLLSLVSGNERLAMEGAERTERAKECVDLAGPWEVFRKFIFESAESLEKARKKGVVCRVLINKPKNEKAFSEIEEFLKKNPNFSRRYVDGTAPLLMSIWDKKHAKLALLSTKPDQLNSNDPAFVQLVQTYFEITWANAKEKDPKQAVTNAENKPY